MGATTAVAQGQRGNVPALARGAAEDGGRRVRRDRRTSLRIALVVGAAVALRVLLASVTANGDGATLAWGSAFAARGYANPYLEVARHAARDPIPLREIYPLSLAQGWVGLYGGAVPLYLGDALGVVDLAGVPDGRDFERSVPLQVLYKSGYVVPEVVIALCVLALVSDRRRRLLALVVVGFGPAMFFAYGQGLPDLWAVAVVMVGLVCIRNGLRAWDSGRARLGWFVAAEAVVAVGGFGTKLMPLVVLAPAAVLVLRDEIMTRRQRVLGFVAVPLLLAVGAAPCLLNEVAGLSLWERFEVAGLTRANPISTLTNVPPAPLWMVAVIGASALLCVGPPTWRRVALWATVVFLALGTVSGGVQQFMLWSVPGLVLGAGLWPRGVALLAAAQGAVTAYTICDFHWYNGLVNRALAPGVPFGEARRTLGGLPFGEVAGPACSALLVAALVGLAVAVWRSRGGEPAGERGGGGAAWVLSGLGAVLLALPASALLAAADGVAAYATPRPRGPGRAPVVRVRAGRPWVGPVLGSGTPVNAVTLRTAVTNRPSDAVAVVELVRGDPALAAGALPVWSLDPRSAKGPVTVPLHPEVAPQGARLRIRLRGRGVREPLVLSGTTLGDGTAVPGYSLRRRTLGETATAMLRAVVSWRRLAVAFAAATGAGLVLWVALAFVDSRRGRRGLRRPGSARFHGGPDGSGARPEPEPTVGGRRLATDTGAGR